MSVLINFKICDNAKECGGAAVCKTGAISWDEQKKSLVIDNSKCTGCGLCEKACPVEAIKVAKTDEEYQKLKTEVEEDPRRISDLFVDRYGASPINPAFIVKEKDFPVEIEQYSRLAVAELFNGESIMCLLRSIPIGELFEGKIMKYGKVKAENEGLLKRYSINMLPALLFFENGKFLGKIEGNYRVDRKNELLALIKSILP